MLMPQIGKRSRIKKQLSLPILDTRKETQMAKNATWDQTCSRVPMVPVRQVARTLWESVSQLMIFWC